MTHNLVPPPKGPRILAPPPPPRRARARAKRSASAQQHTSRRTMVRAHQPSLPFPHPAPHHHTSRTVLFPQADTQTEAAKRAAEVRGAAAEKVGGQLKHRPNAARARPAEGGGADFNEGGGNELGTHFPVRGKFELCVGAARRSRGPPPFAHAAITHTHTHTRVRTRTHSTRRSPFTTLYFGFGFIAAVLIMHLVGCVTRGASPRAARRRTYATHPLSPPRRGLFR